MFKDKNLVTLITANLMAILLAFVFSQDIVSVLWLYWFQSVTFCMISWFRILSFKKFSTKGITPPVPDNSNSAKFTFLFLFIFVYGLFHLVYAIFIGSLFTMIFQHQTMDVFFILLGTAAFIFHQLKELLFSNRRDEIPYLGIEFLKPLKRLLPMHFILLIGPFIFLIGFRSHEISGNYILIIVFQLLITAADIFAYRLAKQKFNIFLANKEESQ